MNDTPAPPPGTHSLLFQRLRWHILRNAGRSVLWRAPVRIVTIALSCLLVWCFVFAISWYGFQFLKLQRLPFPEQIIGTFFDLLFLALALMLVFSGAIILYSSLFAAQEAAFLLGTPAAADHVFAYKFQGAIAFSSWAFLIIGSPILIGYGIVFEAAWYFYALLPLYFIGFVLLPGSFGALLCLLIAYWAPRHRKHVLAAGVLLLLVLAGVWVVQLVRTSQAESWTRDAVLHLLRPFDFARSVVVPSHWIVQGLQAAVPTAQRPQGDPLEAGYRLALIWSNGLLLYLLTAWVARRLYRPAYNRTATGGDLRRRYGGLWLDQTLAALVPFLDPQTRLLIVKDFRTFRRDPAQWAQILIFTGLLVLYFTNTQRFYSGDINAAYRSGVSLLNLAATSLLLCAWTGRFIYPLLSLEGRKFWVLGLLPLRRDRLLWGKFYFSAVGAVVIAEALIMLSDLMLGMPGVALGLHALTVAVLAAGLSGLSVGLGASLPNFRETDPSKIAVGFGGTLNLIASLLFLIAVLVLMAVPWHVVAVVPAPFGWGTTTLQVVLGSGVAAGVALGVTAVLLPLRTGARMLRQMEF
jgi:ABC-2 type transport system permease protein